MKRFISALLAICMVCSFVPTISAETTGTEKSGITIVYDYASQFPIKTGNDYASVETMEKFTFDTSHGLWSYAEYYGGDVRYRNKSVIQLEKGNYWVALEIYVPKSGTYNIEQKYTTYSGSGTLDMYVVPKGENTVYSNSLVQGISPTLSQSCDGANSNFVALADPAIKENVYFDAGYYYVVYRANGGRAMFGNLTLNGGSGKAVSEITSVSAPTELKAGATGNVTANVYYTDLTEGTATAGDVTYESNNTSVLEINASTGAYTAKAAGNATVTVKAGLISKSIDITVTSVDGSGISVIYDYASQFPVKTGNDYASVETMEKFTFDTSHGLWSYAEYYGGDVRYRNKSVIQLEKGNYWVALEIYVPKSGTYNIEQKYTTYSGSGTLDVYIVPKGENTAYSNSLIQGISPTLSQSCDGANSNFVALADPAIKENVQFDAGYYYVVYRANGGRAMFGNLTLNGGDGKAITEITSVSAPSEVKTGTTGNVTANVYYSNLTEGTAAKGEVTYESNNTSVLEINTTTGAYTAKAAGDATITVKAGAISKSIDVTVKDAAKSGVSATYAWATQMNPGVDNGSLKDTTFLSQFTFEHSHNLWKYEAQQSWATVTWRSNDYIQFNRGGGGLWMAFEIYVPKKGAYTLEQKYAQFGGSKSDIDVYMFPKTSGVAFTQADMTADRKVLTLDCKGADGTGVLGQTPAKKDIELEAGYYYVAYLQVKTADGTNVALFGDLTLNGGDGRVLTDITSVSIPSEVRMGTTGTATAEGYYSDLTAGTIAAGDVTYESNNTSVFEINATTGAYTAKAGGDAIVTVKSGDVSKNIAVKVGNVEKSGISVVYDYSSQFPIKTGNDIVSVGDMEKFTFDSSHGLWAYAAYYGSDMRYRNKSVIQLSVANYWAAMEIYVPKSGAYNLEQKYTTYPGSGTLEVYIVPKGTNTAYSNSLIQGVTPTLTQNCDGANSNFVALKDPAIKENVSLDAGYYYVVYKSTGGRAMFGNLTLNGGDGRELVDFEAIKPDFIAEGEAGEVSVVAYYSNATSETYAGEVTYKTEDEDILTIDENGAYEALSSGTAVVTVEVGGLKKDVTFDIRGKSGITVIYDYAKELPLSSSKQTTEVDLGLFSFENSNGLWAYAGHNGGDIRFRNGKIFQLAEKNYWFAMEIYVPKSGMYNLEQEYTTYPGSGTLDVYVLPKGENTSYSDTLIKEKAPTFSQSCEGADKAFTALSEPSIKENVYFDNGYYYIVYKSNGGRAMFGNLTLNGGGERELATISFDIPEITVKGDGGLIAPIGTMSDGTAFSVKDGYIFSSDNEDVLYVNRETGEYTASGAGVATVTVSYDIGRMITSEKKVEVIEGAAAGKLLTYDFAEAIPEYGTDKAFSELSSDDASGAYQFASASQSGVGTQIQYRDTFITLGKGEWFAFEIDIPVSGIYSINQRYGKYNNSTGALEAYIIPKNGNFDISTINNLDATGTQSCFDGDASEYSESATASDFGVDFFEAGKYYVVYKAKYGRAMFGNLILDGRNTFKKLIVSAPKSIGVGERVEIGIEAKSLDMTTIDIETLNLKSLSSVQFALTTEIGDNNECFVYGENEGASEITITADDGEFSDSKTVEIKVIDSSEVQNVEIDISDYIYVRASENIKFIAHMGSGKTIEIPDATYEIIASEPEGAGVVSGNSITGNAEGKITLKASADFKGEMRTAEKEIDILEGMSKQAPTYYTYEMRENVKKNTEKYSWVRSEVNAKKADADIALEDLDAYYDMIIGEGIPRSRSMKTKGHPEIDNCPYCGEYYQFAWKYDILNRPWKAQCPGCKRFFPSNDFESFMKLGLDEQKYYDVDRARQAHHEMLFHKGGEECTCEKPETPYSEEWYEFYGYGNEEGYLYNKLYKEVGSENSSVELLPGEKAERWCVDDGFGYYTGRVFDTGVKEMYCPIALYNYSLLPGISNRISSLGMAYVYTGETKYGVAAAILLDRLADVYPSHDADSFDTGAYQITDGGTGKGKIQGLIQDAYFAKGFALYIDEVFPILKDEAACNQVIQYLSLKADAMGLENKKKTAEDIWRNWEENILLENFEAAKLYKVGGNFGTYQAAIAATALVLDKKPESDEMMDWCFRSGGVVYPQNSETGTYYNTGGNINAQIVDEVDRDGLGTESSASYNCMWWEQLINIAEMSAKYGDPKYDLYQNVKFLKMLEAFSDLVMTNSHTVHIGDCSSGIASATLLGNVKLLSTIFPYVKDTPMAEKIAKYIALYYNYNLDGFRESVFAENPEGLGEEIMSFVENEDGFTESKMLAGYGFSVLRAGKNYKSVSDSTENNNLRDFWIYFGGAQSHRHLDALNLGIEAYGLNIAPDLAYPVDATVNAERMQWTSTTLSHNTVTVDGQQQKNITLPGKPLHFDDSGMVKVLDTSVPEVYEATSEYRRTIVMIEADDDISYGVDFFRVVGGNEHIYSFHALSGDDASVVDGLNLVPQVDEPQSDWTSEDTSSYAGADIKYGPDPNPMKDYNYVTYYPRGTTWLRDVRRSDDVVNDFTADFKITDYNRVIKDNKDIHLSLTMVNDFELSEVAFAKGKVPERATNKNIPSHLEYMLAKREGKNLDSLFTAVYQPYKKEAYISSVEQIVPTIISGAEKSGDVKKAVKVTHTNGRVDYIIYATNDEVTYQLENNEALTFSGFVGVWTLNANREITYSYVLGGDGDVTGKISGFTEGLSTNNYIDITPDKAVSPESLAGKYIFIEHDGVGNAAYEILSAEKKADGDIRLDIGTVTTVRKYMDAKDFDKGYEYNIAKKQKFVISMPVISDSAPVFETYDGGVAGVNSIYERKFTATSSLSGTEIEYIGRTLPRGASIDSETGLFTWKPASSQVGDNHVAITARDSDGRETTIHITITVYGSTSDGSIGGAGGGGGAGESTTPPAEKEEEKEPSTDVENGGSDVPQTPDSENLRFIDLASHAWAEDAINSLADEGIIKGTSENTFSPGNNITRADFAILLVRAFKLSSENTENFSDVKASDYFASELAIARNEGLVGGIGDNKYAPYNNITRQDMMVIVYRALKSMDKLVGVDIIRPENEDFEDVADYAKEAVSVLIGAGLVNGKNGKIAPTDFTTRAEVAVLIKRILEYTK
ncbi:MAG: hypothetical protein E7473_07095 [Ruminococcaceae bacterium]|nr:hypothetical protein [Oscillospiraceae bacterium]